MCLCIEDRFPRGNKGFGNLLHVNFGRKKWFPTKAIHQLSISDVKMLLGNHIKFVTIFVNTIDEIHAIFFKLGIGAVPKIWHSALNIALRKPGNQQPLPCVTFCLFDMGRTNFNTWRAFLVVWILFAFKFFDTHAEICEKIDECSCRKSNGKVISLRQIDGGTTPAWVPLFPFSPITLFYELEFAYCDRIDYVSWPADLVY